MLQQAQLEAFQCPSDTIKSIKPEAGVCLSKEAELPLAFTSLLLLTRLPQHLLQLQLWVLLAQQLCLSVSPLIAILAIWSLYLSVIRAKTLHTAAATHFSFFFFFAKWSHWFRAQTCESIPQSPLSWTSLPSHCWGLPLKPNRFEIDNENTGWVGKDCGCAWNTSNYIIISHKSSAAGTKDRSEFKKDVSCQCAWNNLFPITCILFEGLCPFMISKHFLTPLFWVNNLMGWVEPMPQDRGVS